MDVLTAHPKTENIEFVIGNILLFGGGWLTGFSEYSALGFVVGAIGFWLDIRVFRKTIVERGVYKKELENASKTLSETKNDLEQFANTIYKFGKDSGSIFRPLEEQIESLEKKVEKLERDSRTSGHYGRIV